jgi:hypothetical protein
MRTNSVGNGKANITLNAGELAMLKGIMTEHYENSNGSEKNKQEFMSLYTQMIVISDMANYGSIDEDTFNNMLKHHIDCKTKDTNESKDNTDNTSILTDEEIDCFNAYLDDEKDGIDAIAYGNSDWCAVYRKIVGNKISDVAQRRMDLYRRG